MSRVANTARNILIHSIIQRGKNKDSLELTVDGEHGVSVAAGVVVDDFAGLGLYGTGPAIGLAPVPDHRYLSWSVSLIEQGFDVLNSYLVLVVVRWFGVLVFEVALGEGLPGLRHELVFRG